MGQNRHCLRLSRTFKQHVYQRCTGAGASEWTPAGVLKIFENRSGAGVDFFKEGAELESVF